MAPLSLQPVSCFTSQAQSAESERAKWTWGISRFSMIAAGTDPDAKNPFFHRLDPILS